MSFSISLMRLPARRTSIAVTLRDRFMAAAALAGRGTEATATERTRALRLSFEDLGEAKNL